MIGDGMVQVIDDQFFRYAIFFFALQHSLEEALKHLMTDVVRHYGVPHNIISDWVVWFIWLPKGGSELYFFASLLLDGRPNWKHKPFLKQYLRHYVSANWRDCVELLDISQFSYS